jgi:hypothetical protein
MYAFDCDGGGQGWIFFSGEKFGSTEQEDGTQALAPRLQAVAHGFVDSGRAS